MSKNNIKLIEQKMSNQQQRWSLRKLSIGVASVLLGTTMYFGISNPEVSADTTAKATNTLTQDNFKTKSNTDSVSNETSVNSNNNDTPSSTVDNNQAPSINLAKTTVPTRSAISDTSTIKENKRVDSASALSATMVSSNENSSLQGIVTIKNLDEKGNEKSDLALGADIKNFYANQDTLNIHINLKNLSSTDISIRFKLTGDVYVHAANFDSSKPDQSFVTGDKNWKITNGQNKNELEAIWQAKNGTDPKSLSLTLPIQASSMSDKQEIDSDVELTIDKLSGNLSGKLFHAHIVPAPDIVKDYEIIHGFKMLDTTVGVEKQYGISDQDYKAMKMSDDDKIQQYGVYFNYGDGVDGQALKNVHIKLSFDNGQRIIPSS